MAPSKNKKIKEAPKTSDKPFKPWEENKTIGPGCNCPLGCLVGAAVADGDEFVQFECSAPACTKDLRIHGICYEHWESELVKVVEKASRRGGWRPAWVQQHLWTPTCLRHLPGDFTKCQCGAQLSKWQSAVPVNQAVVVEMPVKKAKHHVPGGLKKLPVLRSIDAKFVGTAAHHLPSSAISHGVGEESDQQQEKRKYPVGMAPPPKKKSQSKTYNCAASGTNTTAPAGSVGTGEKSRVSSICPSDVSDPEIAEQIAAIKFFKDRQQAAEGDWEEVPAKSAAIGKAKQSTTHTRTGRFKLAGGKFDALAAQESDSDQEQKQLPNRDNTRSSPAMFRIENRTVSSSGYNDIDRVGSYDIAKHCLIADTQPFAYSRDAAILRQLARQLSAASPIQPPFGAVSKAFT